jgi:hypothetical protein
VQPPTATISVEGGAVFDEPLVGSRRVWFPYGRYNLTVSAEGYTSRVVAIDAKDRTRIGSTVALQRAPVVEQPPPPPDQGSATGSADVGSGSADVIVESPPPPVIERRSIVPPLVVSGATIGIAGFALGFYMAALKSADDAGEASEQAVYNDARDKAIDRQHMSWAFGGVAAAGAIVSGILWYRYSSPPRVEVQATGTGAAVTLGGRW